MNKRRVNVHTCARANSKQVLLLIILLLLFATGLFSTLKSEREAATQDTLSDFSNQGGPSPIPLAPETIKRFEVIEYEVQQGDTLFSIAAKFGVNRAVIVGSNDIPDVNMLLPGQILRIPKGGILHQVKQGQTLTDISRTYNVPLQEIIEANGLEERKYIYPGEEFFIPGADSSPKFNAIRLSKGKITEFIWPLLGEITSGFGTRQHPVAREQDFHEGIDIKVNEGTAVYAARSGKVVLVGQNGSYGKMIILDHGAYETYYAHLSSVEVYRGQFVEAGQIIGLSGNTGLSTGPHLHFEIRINGEAVDPLNYLP